MKIGIDMIIFDFDGVIVNSGADITNAVQYTMKHFGAPLLTKEEIIKKVGWGADNLIRSCFKGCSEELVKQAVPFYRKYYLENAIVETTLYKNVKEVLQIFDNKKIALVTNKPEDLSKKILEGLQVMKYFDLVIGPESVKNMKPHPEGLLKSISTFGGTPDKAVMVGDTYTDIEAGKSAGTRTCGVTYGLGGTDELLKASPDFVVDDIIKLTDLIE